MAKGNTKINTTAEINARENVSQVVENMSKKMDKSLDKAGRKFDETTKEINANSTKVAKATNSLSADFKSLGIAMAGALSVGAITSFSKASVDAFTIQEKGVIKLQKSLINANKYSKETFQDLLSFASELQNKSTFGDETILPIAQQFIDMKLSVDQTKTSLSALVALAAGKDFETLSQGMELYFTASTGSAEAMNKLGIEIDKNATLTERIDQLNAELLKKYKGQAEVIATMTTGGELQQLANTWGDIQESFGKIITDNSLFQASLIATRDTLDLISGISPQIEGIPTTLEEINAAIADLEAKNDSAIAKTGIPYVGGLLYYADSSKNKEALGALENLRAQLVKTKRASLFDYGSGSDVTNPDIEALGAVNPWDKYQNAFSWNDPVPEFNAELPWEKVDTTDVFATTEQAIDQMMERIFDAFATKMRNLDIPLLDSKPEALIPTETQGQLEESSYLIDGLTEAQLKQYDAAQKVSSGFAAWGTALLGENSKVGKAFALMQGGIEAAAAIQSAANYDFWAAGQHAAAAKQYFDVAKQSGKSQGSSAATSYDPLQAQQRQQNLTVILTNNFDQDGFNTTIDNRVESTVNENIRSQGTISETIRRNLVA